jgi:hypothetical protein
MGLLDRITAASAQRALRVIYSCEMSVSCPKEGFAKNE